jgi:hypothetical protein
MKNQESKKRMLPEQSAVLVETVEERLKMTVAAIAEYLQCSVASVYLWKRHGMPHNKFDMLNELLLNKRPVDTKVAMPSNGIVRVELAFDVLHPSDQTRQEIVLAIQLLKSIEKRLTPPVTGVTSVGEERDPITEESWGKLLSFDCPDACRNILKKLKANGNRPTLATELTCLAGHITRANRSIRRAGLGFEIRSIDPEKKGMWSQRFKLVSVE